MSNFIPQDFENMVDAIDTDRKTPLSKFLKQQWVLPLIVMISAALAIFSPAYGAIWALIVASLMQFILLSACIGVFALKHKKFFYGSFAKTLYQSKGSTRKSLVDWRFALFVLINHLMLLSIAIYAQWMFLAFVVTQVILFEQIIRQAFIQGINVLQLEYYLNTHKGSQT